MKTALGVACVVLFSSACETAQATRLPTPKERVTECEQICGNLGMKLSAFVVMMNSAGCVCEPKQAPASSGSVSREGAGAAAGGVTIAAAAAAAQAAQQQQNMAVVPVTR